MKKQQIKVEEVSGKQAGYVTSRWPSMQLTVSVFGILNPVELDT